MSTGFAGIPARVGDKRLRETLDGYNNFLAQKNCRANRGRESTVNDATAFRTRLAMVERAKSRSASTCIYIGLAHFGPGHRKNWHVMLDLRRWRTPTAISSLR